MSISKWIAIVNPNAGGGAVAREWPVISNLLNQENISFDEMFTTHRYHSVELVIKALRAGYRNFIAVGGDGTLHEIVNGMFHQQDVPVKDLTLAVIPAGSGNDWARMNGITRDYAQAVRVIAEGRTLVQDIGKVIYTETGVTNLRYMVNIAGIGLDANICYFTNKAKNDGKSGRGSYVRAAFRALFGRISKVTVVTADDRPFFSGKAFSIAFGIGRYSGGGMIQVPDAVPDDGLINIMVAGKLPKLKFLLLFKQLFLGTIYGVKQVSHTVAGKFIVRTAKPDRLEIDGEVVGTTPMRIEVIPEALRVVVGHGGTDPKEVR